jgi:hypothetical protein
VSTTGAPTRPVTRRAAIAGLVLGLAFAAVSAYWAVGGRWLLDTVGRSLATSDASSLARVVIWSAVAAKLVAALLPFAAAGDEDRPWHATARALGWTEGVVMAGYGLVLTAVGLLVQAGAIGVAASADHEALRWHAFLWDPWFLLWGLAVLVVMLSSRQRADSATPSQHAQRVDGGPSRHTP